MPNPPKPSKLKVLEGTARKDRANPAEPAPRASTSVPQAPGWLSPAGVEFFGRIGKLLVDLKIMSVADWDALAHLADAHAEYRAARKVTRRRGLTYKTLTQTGATMYRKRPETGIASEAWRRVRQGLADFGLTPSSRSRIQALEDGAIDPLEQFLGRGRRA